jgi:hypothetical protein
MLLLFSLFCQERERERKGWGVEEKMWYLRERNGYERMNCDSTHLSSYSNIYNMPYVQSLLCPSTYNQMHLSFNYSFMLGNLIFQLSSNDTRLITIPLLINFGMLQSIYSVVL